MASVQEEMANRLVHRMVWPDDAQQIVENCKAQMPEIEESRWQEPIQNYPNPLIAVVWLAVAGEAIRYLEQKSPKSIALQMLRSRDGKP